MKAQLVLQFQTPDDLGDFDKLTRFEEALPSVVGRIAYFDKLTRFEEALPSVVGRIAYVDGHDFGSGEMNIFILTDDPIATFKLVQQMDESMLPSKNMKAAYRLIKSESYIYLWPPELNHFQLT